MINRENLNGLIQTIETICEKQFPEIPQEIIDEIILVEFDNIDNRTSAQKLCQQSLEDFFLRLETGQK